MHVASGHHLLVYVLGTESRALSILCKCFAVELRSVPNLLTFLNSQHRFPHLL